jgi:OOP family OmpA-OmpF porin
MKRNIRLGKMPHMVCIGIILVLTVGMYSCIPSQISSRNRYVSNSHLEQLAAASKGIHIASNVNVDAVAEPLPAYINSPYMEMKPALSPGDDHNLYFSRSNHPGNVGGEEDKEDIWYSKYDVSADKWSEPIHLPGNLNNTGPNFICNVSVTGDSIALGNQYLKNGRMKSGCSFSVNKNGVFTDPKPIVVVNDYNISDHAGYFLSLKFGVIISAVQRCDTYGDRDLYISFREGAISSEPINMGFTINSEGEESSPSLSPDGMTLYFASKGHAGYGGYDVFMTHRLDDSWTNWTKPENLGPAINGPMDDEFFIISHCGQYALFSKEVNKGNVDLFEIAIDVLFTEPQKIHRIPAGRQVLAMNFH